jgi:hypothetical protein
MRSGVFVMPILPKYASNQGAAAVIAYFGWQRGGRQEIDEPVLARKGFKP